MLGGALRVFIAVKQLVRSSQSHMSDRSAADVEKQ